MNKNRHIFPNSAQMRLFMWGVFQHEESIPGGIERKKNSLLLYTPKSIFSPKHPFLNFSPKNKITYLNSTGNRFPVLENHVCV
jgi:hypothetical protein